MGENNLIVDLGREIILENGYNITGKLPITQFQLGINATAPFITDTELNEPVPFTATTICEDGSVNMTAGTGGSVDSTDNTDTFKNAFTVVNSTSQNLIKSGTGTNPYWNITALANQFTSNANYFGIWLYIKDAATLAKFFTLGSNPALYVSIGNDSSNRYEFNWTPAELSVGWNWLSSYPNALVNDDTTYGAPTVSNYDYFRIQIRLNNTTDTFAAGDVIWDVLVEFDDADMFKILQSGYPTTDLTSNTAEYRGIVEITESNGFFIDNSGVFNNNSPPEMHSEDKWAGESKTAGDRFIFIWKDRII